MDILVYVLIVALIYFVERYFKLSKQQKLFDLVAWCASSSYGIDCVRSDPLRTCISRAQRELNISPSYRIDSKDDWQLVQEILCEYQRDLSNRYFNKLLDPNALKGKLPVRDEDYFMFSLYCFLDDHQCDSTFLGHEMREQILDYTRHSPMCYDATYSLSDFALVYTKLYYIVYLSCKSSKVINPTGNRFGNLDHIKETIDTKQLSVSAVN